MVVLGENLALWIDEGGGRLKRIACDKSCSVNIKVDTKDVIGKTSGNWIQKKATRVSWSMSSASLYTPDTFEELFSRMISMQPVVVTFTPKGINNAKKYYGNAIIAGIDGDAELGAAGQLSVQLEGSGMLLGSATTGDFNYDFNVDFKIL